MALDTILRAVSLTLGQLGDPRFRRVLLLGIGLSLLFLIGAGAGFVSLLKYLTGETMWIPFIGEVRWLDDVISWGAALLLMLLSVFLMVPVASAITSLFLDDVADAVEAEHYAHLPQKPRTPLAESLRDTIGYLGVIVGVNLLALILYVIFSPFALFIFWAVNGLLLGREYYTLAAMRRVGRAEAHRLRRKHALTLWLAGILMAIPLSVPILNLLVPILGAAVFTHLYHLLPQTPDGSSARYRPR